MPLQVWGTFSVSDHLAERPFVADVLLYDRLVVPVPGKDVDHWHKNKWKPDTLTTLVGILATGDLVRQVVWDYGLREEFEAVWQEEKERAQDRFRRGLTVVANPMAATRGALFKEAEMKRDAEFFSKNPDVVVESVAAYPSYERFDLERAPGAAVAAQTGEFARQTAEEAPEPSSVFGWEFFVPQDDARSDEDLLSDAVQLATKRSFRKARAEFHEVRAQLYKHGGSSRTLWADMEKRLERYRQECDTSQLKTRSAYAFWIAAAGATLGGLLVPPTLPVMVALYLAVPDS
jgi:hypothetical protein